jgi:hypothetical protein
MGTPDKEVGTVKTKIKGVGKQVKDVDQVDPPREAVAEYFRAKELRKMAQRLRTEAMLLDTAAAAGEQQAVELAERSIAPQ